MRNASSLQAFRVGNDFGWDEIDNVAYGMKVVIQHLERALLVAACAHHWPKIVPHLERLAHRLKAKIGAK